MRLGLGRATFALVWYEDPAQRSWIIDRLQAALPDLKLAKVSLQDPELDNRDLSGRFFTNLRGLTEKQAGGSFDVALLLDWEQRLDLEGPIEQQPARSLLGVFNLGRNHLRNAFPCPLLVFLPRKALVVVQRLAPDFASWAAPYYFPPGSDAPPEPPSTNAAPRRDPEPPGPMDTGSAEAPADIWTVLRGASALTEADPILGRETDHQELLKLLIRPEFRCGTLWGESGCGKTSLVQAGLLPSLRRLGHVPVYVHRYEAGPDVVNREVAAAAGVSPGADLHQTVREIEKQAALKGRGRKSSSSATSSSSSSPPPSPAAAATSALCWKPSPPPPTTFGCRSPAS